MVNHDSQGPNVPSFRVSEGFFIFWGHILGFVLATKLSVNQGFEVNQDDSTGRRRVGILEGGEAELAVHVVVFV